MKIVCKNCGWRIEFPDTEIRLVPVEKGDGQLFQVRDLKTGTVRNHIFQCGQCGRIRGEVQNGVQTEWIKERVVSIRIFSDPTPNGQINQRVVQAPLMIAAQHTDMTEEEQKHLMNTLVFCGKKLAAVWKHMRAYAELEDRLIQQAEQLPAPGPGEHVHLEVAQDLLIELDEFLVQVKSSLDYLVKIPIPILNFARWPLRTFGDKGKDVIQALRNNMPRDKKKGAEFIAKHVIEEHQPWLTAS